MPPPDLPSAGLSRKIDWHAFSYAATGLAVIGVARVAPLGAGWLPPCLWTVLRGHTCLFCGTTRSFQCMARGNWRAAFSDNIFAPLLFVALAVAIGWHAWKWARSLRA